MARIKMKRPAEAITLESAFKEFVIAQSAKGVAEKTLKTYHSHFHAAGKHIDTEKTFAELQKYDLDQMVVSMREAGLAHNSISSYVRVMKTFLTWCNHEGYTFLNIPTYKQKETYNEFPYANDEDLLASFNIALGEDYAVATNNDSTLRVRCPSAEIDDFWVSDINTETNTFDFLKVTFDIDSLSHVWHTKTQIFDPY